MNPPEDLLPTVLDPAQPGALTPAAGAASVVPSLIAIAGETAAWRYIDFFTANIRNPNTRRAYRAPVASSSPGAKHGGAPWVRSGRSTCPPI